MDKEFKDRVMEMLGSSDPEMMMLGATMLFAECSEDTRILHYKQRQTSNTDYLISTFPVEKYGKAYPIMHYRYENLSIVVFTDKIVVGKRKEIARQYHNFGKIPKIYLSGKRR